MSKKVLLIRLDKIGDLICTMCVDQVSFLKDADVQWVIAKGLAFVPKNADPERPFIELKKDKTSLKELRELLKQWKPDVAVSFQAPWWVHYALWAEKVPVRAGVLSQWHSFLFLNKGLRQKRSRAEMHESDYNLDLLRHAFDIQESIPCPKLTLKAKRNTQIFEKFHIHKDEYLVIHPGMAGSALNWPIPLYIDLIELALPRFKIALTGTAADEPWLSEIKDRFKNEPRVATMQGLLSAEELFTVLENSFAVIAPSTGVAHMAASLSARVLGIYSPIRVQHPRRWAARGRYVQIFAPTKETLEEAPVEIMKQISPEKIWNAIQSLPENWR